MNEDDKCANIFYTFILVMVAMVLAIAIGGIYGKL